MNLKGDWKMLYALCCEPVETGSDGVFVLKKDGITFLRLDSSYSDKVNFSFRKLDEPNEIVLPHVWLRVALNVCRYNKQMYLNFPNYFHGIIDHILKEVLKLYKYRKDIELVSAKNLLKAKTFDEIKQCVERYQNDKNVHELGLASSLCDIFSSIFDFEKLKAKQNA